LPELFGLRQIEAEEVTAIVGHIDILTYVGLMRSVIRIIGAPRFG